MKLSKLLFAVVGASVLLGALVSTASARNVSVSNQNLRATFQRVTFNLPFGDTVCAVSLEGSLHARTIAKVVGALIGYITRARLGACSTGSATILTETLPWHVTYRNFTGRLPAIETIGTDVINASFRVREPFGVTCLARSTTSRPAIGTYRVSGGTIASATIGGTVPTDCLGQEGVFSSDAGVVTLTGATTRITVTLI